MLEIKSQHLTFGGPDLQTTYLQILYSGRAANKSEISHIIMRIS